MILLPTHPSIAPTHIQRTPSSGFMGLSPLPLASSTAVSSGDHEEVTYAHIEKTAPHIPMFDATVEPPGAFTTSRRLWRRGASGSPTIPRSRADAERTGEEPWHELRSKIVSSA
jgi:hypothetical protein